MEQGITKQRLRIDALMGLPYLALLTCVTAISSLPSRS